MSADDLARLETIFRVVLDLPDATPVSKLRRLTEPQWDSLAHVSLIAALESEFNLRLDTDHAGRLTSFEAARILLDELL